MTANPRSQRLTLEVERLDNRGSVLRFTSVRMPGWAAVARTPVELARVMDRAFTEADIASYARWRGSTYDEPDAMALAAAGDPRPIPPRAPVVRHLAAVPDDPPRPASQLPDGAMWGNERYLLRPDVADPADWTVLPNGRLLAPSNPDRPQARRLTYGPDTTMGRRIIERRRAAGLSTAA